MIFQNHLNVHILCVNLYSWFNIIKKSDLTLWINCTFSVILRACPKTYSGEKYSTCSDLIVALLLGKLIKMVCAVLYILFKKLFNKLGCHAGPPLLPATPVDIATSNFL